MSKKTKKKRKKYGPSGKRRANGCGSLETRGEQRRIRYSIVIDGKHIRKSRKVTPDLVREAMKWNDECGLYKKDYDETLAEEPLSEEAALLALAYVSNGNGIFSREAELRNNIAKLEGAKAERERLERQRAEEQAKEQAKAEQERAIPVAGAFEFYKASDKRPDSGPRTLAGYETQYNAFADWIKQHYPKAEKLRDITPAIASAFMSHLKKSLSRNTHNKYLVFLRGFWRTLRWNPDAMLSVDPWEGIKTLVVRADEVKHEELTTEELARIGVTINTGTVSARKLSNVFMFNGIDIRDEIRQLFAIGIFTGLRLGDCAMIRWGDIDLIKGKMTITPRKTARRFKQQISIPIHPCLSAILADIPSANRKGFVMPTLADIYENRESSIITNRVQAILAASGIQTTTKGEHGTKTRTVKGFHSLRHFFASWLDNHGVNHSITNYLTCHSQGKVEAGYFHRNLGALRDAVGTIPSLPQYLPSNSAAEVISIPAAEPGESNSKLAEVMKLLDDLTADELKLVRDEIDKRNGGSYQRTHQNAPLHHQ